MFYYPIDNSVELVIILTPLTSELIFNAFSFCFLQYDVKQHRKFLKRTKQENLSPKDVYVGNTVNVFSRQMLITCFADEYTRKNLGAKQEK